MEDPATWGRINNDQSMAKLAFLLLLAAPADAALTIVQAAGLQGCECPDHHDDREPAGRLLPRRRESTASSSCSLCVQLQPTLAQNCNLYASASRQAAGKARGWKSLPSAFLRNSTGIHVCRVLRPSYNLLPM